MGKPFSELAKDVTDRYLSWDPALATQVGWHKYDSLLKDPSRKAIEYHIAKSREFIRLMQEFPVEELSPDEIINRDLAVYLFKLTIFEKADLRLYERHSTAADDIGYSLFFLSSRKVPSFDARMESLISRIEKIPRFLEKSKEVLVDPYRLWNEVALETGKALPPLVREIEQMVKNSRPERDFEERASRAADAAVSSLEAYNSWLENEVLPMASPKFTLSPAEYETYLGMKGYDVTMAETLEIGRRYLLVAKEAMSQAASELGINNVDDALETMKEDHPPTFQAVLDEYRRSAERARAFVLEKKLATLPEGERLEIIETPHFMRPVAPFAGQFEPGKYDGNATGLFLLTPDDSNPNILREHSYACIGNTTVHEGYPGHHIQGVCSNLQPSWIRTTVTSVDFAEGWGLYCEELMLSEGYNDTPLGRLANLNDFAFRLCRQIAEVELPTGAMTLGEATELLHQECHMEPEAARLEARSCALHPTYYIAYFIGQLAILQLRDDVRAAVGKRFSLKFFHDALLYAGCMPMSFMRRAMALKVKSEFGVELGPQKESLYTYAMRRARKLGRGA